VFDALAFVERHGVVLAAARGPVPSIAAAIRGAPTKGPWGAHPAGHAIFAALEVVSESPDVRCFKLVDGKVTFVHRRLWPALVRLVETLGAARLTEVRQTHTPTGKHVNTLTPYPTWVPPDVQRAAAKLSLADARAALGAWVDSPPQAKRSR